MHDRTQKMNLFVTLQGALIKYLLSKLITSKMKFFAKIVNSF